MVNGCLFLMRHRFKAVSAAALLALFAAQAHASSRIKDIVDVEGVRTNDLVGYGLVVGLNGTGDTVRNCPQLLESMNSMMDRLQTNMRSGTLNSKDAAAVIVTASLPPFAAAGSKLDVTVSAMCDSKSLQGGTLMVTPLAGADNAVYAVGQGKIETGSVSAGGASGSSVTRGVPTSGRIASGGMIEKETDFDINKMSFLKLTLHNPDFTTAKHVASTIVAQYPGCAIAMNPTIVAVRPPQGMSMMDFLALAAAERAVGLQALEHRLQKLGQGHALEFQAELGVLGVRRDGQRLGLGGAGLRLRRLEGQKRGAIHYMTSDYMT